jgi:hypothetical protein
LKVEKEILWFRMPISMKEQQIIIFHNELNAEMFEGNDISVFCGTYGYRSWNISSKQRSIEVFLWINLGGIGLEMEGSYYQKPSSQPRK